MYKETTRFLQSKEKGISLKWIFILSFMFVNIPFLSYSLCYELFDNITIAIIQVVSLIAIIFVLIINRKTIVLPKIYLVLLPMLMFVIIGCLYYKQERHLLNYSFLFLLIIVLYTIRDWYFPLIVSVTVIGLFFAVYSILRYYDIIQPYLLLSNYYSSSAKTAIAIANAVIICGGIILQKSHTKSNLFFPFIILLVLLTALILSSKRAHTLFPIIALLLTWLLLFNKIKLKYIIRFVLVITLSLILFNILRNYWSDFNILLDRFTGNDINAEISLKERFGLWNDSLNVFFENPVFGIGWRGFHLQNITQDDAHNVFIQLLSETGVVGFSLFFFWFVYSLYRTYKSYKYHVDVNTKLVLLVSFGYQIWFLLYCLTGNPLYDEYCFYPYFLFSSIAFSVKSE